MAIGQPSRLSSGQRLPSPAPLHCGDPTQRAPHGATCCADSKARSLRCTFPLASSCTGISYANNEKESGNRCLTVHAREAGHLLDMCALHAWGRQQLWSPHPLPTPTPRAAVNPACTEMQGRAQGTGPCPPAILVALPVWVRLSVLCSTSCATSPPSVCLPVSGCLCPGVLGVCAPAPTSSTVKPWRHHRACMCHVSGKKTGLGAW